MIIPFVPKPRGAVYLTPVDLMEIERWRDHALQSGYDRMVIHEREPGDFPEMGNILCLHRRGEAWSRWVFARQGAFVMVWCSKTGVDLGQYPTMEEAFQAVMPAAEGTLPDAAQMDSASNVVTALLQRLPRAASL